MTVDSIPAANMAMTLAYASIIPLVASGDVKQEVADRVLAAAGIPIIPESTWTFVETIYANREGLTEEVLERAAEVCDYATMMGWYELWNDNRGMSISEVLRGELTDEAAMPKPVDRFMVREPETAPEPPVP